METNLESSAPVGFVESEISPLGRWLAGAQQLKDTLTILGMNIVLLFGFLFFGLPLPGLVLYGLRWRLARGTASRVNAIWLWALGLLHEVVCAALFASADVRSELHEMAEYLTYGYALGAFISLVGLIEILSNDETSAA
ncbi:hypothetical protein [Hymenobacter lucidus]|uniref:DUF805 domain-containing protein n=1 Tax=Hymenobacter lucidus TaxID=2880930 RepID=A0ABS8ANN7_9BACT|nr:hypothetical protein [Hymenobacter lucidus]MCB2407396.1 hypothetical protein [Hymenobacter lucidus]